MNRNDCCYYSHNPTTGALAPVLFGAPANYRVTSFGSIEPVTLAEARLHLRVDAYGSPAEHPDDQLIMLQLKAARQWCEQYLGFSLAQQTIEAALDAFVDPIPLPVGPVQEVDWIRYLDEDGIEQILDPAIYTVDPYQNVIRLATDAEWPDTKVVRYAVKVQYLTGQSLPGESPQGNQISYQVIAAIKLMLAHLYEHREGVAAGDAGTTLAHEVPLGITALLDFAGRSRKGFA